jgi:flagellar motor switch protein FliM
VRYSLREPLAIPVERLDEARQRLQRVVALLAQSCPGEGIDLGLDGLQQQTVAAALSVLPPPAWIAGLVRPGTGGLALALHPAVGLALVEAALGGAAGAARDAREPTALESRVLTRVLSSVADPLGALFGETLSPVACEPGVLPPALAAAGETMVVGLLRFRLGQGDHASLLLVTPSLLLPGARSPGADRARAPGPLAPQLERVPVSLRPVLRAGRLSFGDLLDLQAGKLLQLDAPEDARFELRVAGRAVALGRNVRSADRVVFSVERRSGGADRSRREEER